MICQSIQDYSVMLPQLCIIPLSRAFDCDNTIIWISFFVKGCETFYCSPWWRMKCKKEGLFFIVKISLNTCNSTFNVSSIAVYLLLPYILSFKNLKPSTTTTYSSLHETASLPRWQYHCFIKLKPYEPQLLPFTRSAKLISLSCHDADRFKSLNICNSTFNVSSIALYLLKKMESLTGNEILLYYNILLCLE